MIKSLKEKIKDNIHLKEVFTGSAITFVIKITGMIIGYLVILIISKQYGAEGVGIYNVTLNVLVFVAMLASMGMNVSILRYVGQFNKDGEQYKLRQLYCYALEFIVPFSLVLAVLLYYLSEKIAVSIFHNADYKAVLELSAFIVPFLVLQNISVEFIRGLKHVKISEYFRSINGQLINIILLLIIGDWFFYKEMFKDIFELYDQIIVCFNILNYNYYLLKVEGYIFTIYKNIISFNVFWPMFTFGVGIVVGAICTVYYIVKVICKFENKTNYFSRRELLLTSLPMMTTGISLFIQGNISLFFLQILSTTENAGIYSVVMKLSLLISIVLIVINTISAPKFSELYWNKDFDRLQKLIKYSVKIIFLISLVISILLVVFSIPILRVFGDSFIIADSALKLLIIGQLVNSATGSVGIFMNMTGHQKIFQNINVIMTIINIVFNYYLIPKYGINGAAFSSMSTIILTNVIAAYYVKTRMKFTTYYSLF